MEEPPKIEASIKPLKEILCHEDNFYQIPDYQRPYAWSKDQLSDLIDDLSNAYINNKDEYYFCGSIGRLIPWNKEEKK